MPPNPPNSPPYGYVPMPSLAPPRQWPVPAARHVPLIWTVSLAVVTALAVVLVALAPVFTTAAPAPGGTTVYVNNLAHDDNAWTLANGAQGQCTYANGGLDATTSYYSQSETDTSINSLLGRYDPLPLCALQANTITDLNLSVRILPQANLTYALQPTIFIHNDIALLFTTAGEFAMLAHDSLSNHWLLLYEAPTNQWHTAGMLSNAIVVQVRGTSYTVALNGAQIFHGDLGDAVPDTAATPAVALGAFTTSSATGEAAFADLTLTTP